MLIEVRTEISVGDMRGRNSYGFGVEFSVPSDEEWPYFGAILLGTQVLLLGAQVAVLSENRELTGHLSADLVPQRQPQCTLIYALIMMSRRPYRIAEVVKPLQSNGVLHTTYNLT